MASFPGDNTINTRIRRVILLGGLFLLAVFAIGDFAPSSMATWLIPPTTRSMDYLPAKTYLGATEALELRLLSTPKGHQMLIEFYTQETSSRELALHIIEGARVNRIPATLAFAIAWAESSYNPGATNFNSSSVDRGMFQLNSDSFPHLSVNEFYDPFINTMTGLSYLRYCLDRGGSDMTAVAMYNAGPDRVAGGKIPESTDRHVYRLASYLVELENRFREFCREELPLSVTDSWRHSTGERRPSLGS